MSRDVGRRNAMRRLALAAVLPFGALGLPLASLRASGRRAAVPEGSYLLERVLTRELAGDAAIVVTRRWRIGFAPDADGIAVRGEQVFADVAAPPALAALAAIERSRSASSLFPLVLDASGAIRGGGGGDATGGAAEPLAHALETGRALVSAMPVAAADKQDAGAFMARLATLGAEAISRLPRDLFFPRAGRDALTQRIALPGGGSGTVAIISDVRVHPESGLLLQSERRVHTRAEIGERTATERWSLAQI